MRQFFFRIPNPLPVYVIPAMQRYLLLFALSLTTVTLRAQSPLDIGFNFSPHLRYISSTPIENAPDMDNFTIGNGGVSMNVDMGGYLEVAFTPRWYVRGGVAMSFKRMQYRTTRTRGGEQTVGHNHLRYTNIEVPLSIVHRFSYERNYDNFLVGLTTNLFQRTGKPYVFSSFSDPDNAVLTGPLQNITVFAGYERYLSSTLVLGLEPYLSYAPTTFELETHSIAKVRAEAGLAIRLRIDN